MILAARVLATADLVDAAAQTMTTAAPDAGLRRVFVERLARRQRIARAFILLPFAAAAVMAFAASMLRPVDLPAPPVLTASADARVVPIATETVLDALARLHVRRPTRASGETPVDAIASAWHARTLPRITLIERLMIDAIQPDPLAIPQLKVKPLTPGDPTTGAGGGGN